MDSVSAGISQRVNNPERVGPQLRDAASVVLLRQSAAGPQVLMGQRGAAAVFMPDMFVFPGGAVDPADLRFAGPLRLEAATARGLAVETSPAIARALPLAAIRELWEETGLLLGHPEPTAAVDAESAPEAWRTFLAEGFRPKTAALRFIFRAVTPQGRPRRFDARFFLAAAESLCGDPSGFTAGDAELRHLQWIGLSEAGTLRVPFITAVVLSEIEAMLAHPEIARRAPYFHHDSQGSHFRMI